MDKQYVIFDLDGTLVDSMHYWKQLGKEYLKKRGVTNFPKRVEEQLKAVTMTEAAALFIREFGLSETKEQIAAQMNEMMENYYREQIPLKKGVLAYLQRLKEEGKQMCVASATDASLIEICLSRLGILDYFSFLLSCEMVGVGKRSPDIYEEAARRFGVLPQEIAVYEDALYAARTAKEAGFYVVGVFDEFMAENFTQLQVISDEVIIDW